MNLASWYNQTITVASVTGKNNYGVPTFGAQRTIKARVQAVRRLVRGANGQEAQADHLIITDQQIALTDRIWLPGTDTAQTNTARLPIAIAQTPDKWGRVVAYEVML